MAEHLLEKPEDLSQCWHNFRPTTLLIKAGPLGLRESFLWSTALRLGYSDLPNNTRMPGHTEIQFLDCQRRGLLDEDFELTSKGDDLLNYLCREFPLRVFADVIMEYRGLRLSDYEAKPSDLDQTVFEDRPPGIFWEKMWRIADEHGLSSSLAQTLKFENMAIYIAKLPDWADPITYRHPHAANIALKPDDFDELKRKFHRIIIQELKKWFKNKL